ncbi:MAG: pectate lyase [Promethearchaeota archaeon]
MNKKNFAFQIINSFILFIAIFGIFLYVFIEFRYELYFTPFNIPLFVALLFIYVPIEISLIAGGISNLRNKSNKKKRDLNSEKQNLIRIQWILYQICLFCGTTLFIITFGSYFDSIIRDMDEPIFSATVALFLGGIIWLFIFTYETKLSAKNKSIFIGIIRDESDINDDTSGVAVKKNFQEFRLNYRKIILKSKNIGVLLILLFSILNVGSTLFIKQDTCFMYTNYLKESSYDLPTGSHYNSKLDNIILINQTILQALEYAMRNMTRFQQMGGFPIGAKSDGSIFWSDRGASCPLFPDEFSLQGGTSLVASAYLEMYKLEPNPVYLNVALAAADALVAVQDEVNGGFFYDGRRYPDGRGYQPHPRNPQRHAVLDDNTMQSCLSFLIDIYNLTKEQKYLAAINKGFDCLFNIEAPGGGWPQRSNYPSYKYPSYITLNDNCMHDVVFLMLKAYNLFLDEKYLNAAERAGQFLIRVQGNGGSEFQKAWAQQYKDDMPAWARSFEPPAMCSKQTALAIEILMELYIYTKNATYLTPIDPAINWLNGSKINWTEDGTNKEGWARLYELETNKPIYGIREGGEGKEIPYVYSWDEAYKGYDWRDDFGIDKIIENYYKLNNSFNRNITAYLQWKNQPKSLESLESSAFSAYNKLNKDYFWLDEDGNIRDRDFTNNALKIIRYFIRLIE